MTYGQQAHSVRQFVRQSVLTVISTGKVGIDNATQKSSGNGKDLLQIHVSTSWVGRDYTPVRKYYTCAVTQIGMGSR